MSALTVAQSPATASVNRVIGKKVVTTLSVDCSRLGSAVFGLPQDARAVRISRAPETVKSDLFYSKPVLDNDGTILCDDYNLSYAPGVKQAIDEFVKNNNVKFEILFDRFAKIEKK